jgi:hypothetical protein
MTDDLLENLDANINSDIHETFDAYTRSIIQFLKQKEIETKNEYSTAIQGGYNNREDDEDMMFGKMDEPTEPNHASLWGKDLVVKRRNRVGTIDDVLFKQYFNKANL